MDLQICAEARIAYMDIFFSIFGQQSKTRKHIHNLNIPIQHSSDIRSDTENLETWHHTRAMKDTRNDFWI